MTVKRRRTHRPIRPWYLTIIPATFMAVCVASGSASAPAAGGDDLPWIEVDPHSITALREAKTGRPFVAVGINYFGPHMGWAPKLWRDYEPKTVRRHLQLVRDQGFNTVRVFLTLDAFHRQPGRVRAEGVAKFRSFVGICRELGIRIIPSGPDHWEGVPGWLRGKDPFADESVLRASETWWEAFVGEFRDEPTILAWDLLNEPTVRWNTPAMKQKWNVWLGQKYDSIEKIAAAYGTAAAELGQLGQLEIPSFRPAQRDRRLLDYQRFRESIGDTWTRRLVAAIRHADQRHLVTIGHIQWAGPTFLPSVRSYAGFDLRQNARQLDFVTIHFYPLAAPRPSEGPAGVERNAIYLESLLHDCSVGKPVMLGEFAWYGGGEIRAGGRVTMPHQTVQDQLAWNTKLLEVSRGRVCGWLHWAFADTPTSRDLTRWSGLWTEDLQLKPWGRVFGQFAREGTRRAEPERPFSERVRSFRIDRDAVLTDPGSVGHVWD